MVDPACGAQARCKGTSRSDSRQQTRANGQPHDSVRFDLDDLCDGLAHAHEKQLESILISVQRRWSRSNCTDAKRD